MKRIVSLALAIPLALLPVVAGASGQPSRARHGTSRKELAFRAGLEGLQEGGDAVDASVATALALAVTLPRAGNIINTVLQTILNAIDFNRNAQGEMFAGGTDRRRSDGAALGY